MSKSKIMFFFVCLLMIVPAPIFAERMTDNWKLTGYTKYRDAVFADMSRLSSSVPGVTAVWLKIAPSKRSKYLHAVNEYLESVNKNDPGFRSVEILCEVHCTGHLIRFMKFVYMDGNRNIIWKTYEAGPVWMQINQGGIWHPVEKAACAENK
jgi:hypothetical protein